MRLENRRGLTALVGSNPTLSANARREPQVSVHTAYLIRAPPQLPLRHDFRGGISAAITGEAWLPG